MLSECKRLVFAWNTIDYGFSERVIQKLLEWRRELKDHANVDPSDLPTILINSEGGSLQDAWAVVDVMDSLGLPVRTIGVGSVQSAGLVLFTAGYQGMRILYPHVSLMIHHYMWAHKQHPDYADLVTRRPAEDMANAYLEKFYLSRTKLDAKKFRKLNNRTTFFSAKDALTYGFADRIIE